ncbi:PAS domain S-box-containing protein [Herbaspirillum sp. Sphag1AN]|uniref:response regulator n=1 Tax=unclassified Herbaspirillum TaxID=2624150 RepID=UPI00161477A4|nr:MULTISPECIES: response regulator [unclassified Herbaspirillum]MBB3214513.1 PAS domain S-box-containing protein [Herbaspirillum sp. Sphag1AN]MBB3247647.1 PAS domain S-box-containing protein [Herbaspirillum sp. Sphag64]
MFRSKLSLPYFWAQFLPLALLVLGAAAFRYNNNIDVELHRLQMQQQEYVALGAISLANDMDAPLRHLSILVHENPIQAAINDPSEINKGLMADSFSTLILRNPVYDQVRWIDEGGNEIVNVMAGLNGPERIAEQALANKKNMPYFARTMALPRNEILLSPLELYKTNGHVDAPHKPVLRLSAPISDANGKPRGILIINLLMAPLLEHFANQVEHESNRAMLLNGEGYWLYNTNTSDEWGFMFGHEVTIGKQFARIWQMMQTRPQGNEIDDGIWSWQRVELQVGNPRYHVRQPSPWTVAMYLPSQRLLIDRNLIMIRLGAFVAVVLLVLGLLCWRLASIRRKRELENHDRLRTEAELVVSEHRVAELERYQEARSMLASIVASSDDAIIGTGLDDIITSWNPGAERVFGYLSTEVLSQSIYMLVPAERTEETRGLVTQVAEGSRIVNFETVRWHRDGRLLDISVTVSPILDNQKNIIGTSYIARDISDRKRLEKEVNQHRQHLEALVEQQTGKLREVNRNLELALSRSESATRAKSSFLSNMSHEIRTPMNAVLGLTYLLEKTSLQADQRDLIRKILTAGQSLLGIINDILDVSKIEAGRLEIESVPFRLSTVLENVVNVNVPAIGDKQVELVVGFNYVGIEHLYGDALRLEQILTNLTSNAIKFTTGGEISIRAETISKNGDQVVLRFAVTDSGIGIPKSRQQDIFHAFTQEDTSTTRRYGGTGLGLTICRHLVQLMGGEIGVISEPGEGSQFWFTLPFQVLPESVTELQAGLVLQVLVADDHDSARAILADTVKSIGWQVEVAESGEDALSRSMAKIQHNNPYDVFLLDWRMDGIDGLTTARAIREASVAQSLSPVIIIATGHTREDLWSAADPGLIDAVISKPVTPSTLYNTIIQAYQRRGTPALQPSTQEASQEHADMRGLRVLVVDDSEINCEVARRILESEGVIVSCVNDGSEAVTWLREQSADLVFMDIQMPLMDGYQATQEIRNQLQLSALPIIALTAGAFKAQQEAALAAGMDGFLSKPYNIEQILSVVRQHAANPHADKTAGPVTVTKASAAPAPVLNIDVGLEAWGSVDLYRKFLLQFAEQYGGTADQIVAHLLVAETAPAKVLAHKLRGSAGTLALNEVYELAGDLEVLLVEQVPIAACQERAGQLRQAVQRAQHAIADYAEASQPS